ncbi:MAG: acetate--CoA ligase family protein, partial [Proteobacteria bacterium]|nr:acetate--CoA ligase family protein [Pseudomonadota bacterium]
KRLFQIHGAPVTEDKLAVTADEAVRMAEGMGGKVALKIVSKDILHKSDVGGVRLNVGTKDEIKKAFKQIVKNVKAHHPDADIKGVLVSPMAKPGVEVIIGTKLDDQFGPVIMFGLGGIMVEVLKDVSFRVLPISPRSARHMMEDIRSAPLLDGVRGKAPHDKAAVRKLLLICSEIVEAYPEIAEMDLNPVIVYEKGISVVDARVILKKPSE